MGSYVSSPVTDKDSTDECNEKLVCGASSMQGWRLSQEDAHNCILDYDKNTSFFAVYDGHGGHEVAQYCAENLPQFIKNSQEYKENKIEDALSLGFLRFDATIATPEVIKILRKMEGRDDSDEDEEENVNHLYEEAAMPIEQVIEKYAANLTSKKEEKNKDKNDCDATVGTSSSAACSSSSSSCDKIPDGVSSSSEAQSSEKNGEESENGDDNVPEPSGSNSLQADSTPNEKTDDIPVQNGEISTPSEEQPKSDVTSSSTPIENGTPSKKGKGKAVVKPEVKKAVNTRPQRNAQQLYKNWLDFGEDSDDSSDEEDQTFEGPNEASSDEEEGVNVAIDVSEDESSEEDEEEESDDEDDIEEGDERSDEANRAIARSLKGEPGSDSGCTAVVALLRDNQLFVANAGDSRCIVCRNGKAIEMSIDHKPEDEPEMQRIIAAGGEVTSDGRVNGGLNLSRAIGDHAYKKNKDLPDREQMISALPDIKTLTIDPNEDEFMVLACDGIWNSMSSQEVVDFVRPRMMENREKLSTICEEIFDHCLAPHTVRDGTGCDNMTAVIIKFKSNNKRPISPHPDENEAKRTKTEPESVAQVHTTV